MYLWLGFVVCRVTCAAAECPRGGGTRTARAGYSEGCSGHHLARAVCSCSSWPFLPHLTWEYCLDVLVLALSYTKTKLNGLQCFLIYQHGIPQKMRNAEFEEKMSILYKMSLDLYSIQLQHCCWHLPASHHCSVALIELTAHSCTWLTYFFWHSVYAACVLNFNKTQTLCCLFVSILFKNSLYRRKIEWSLLQVKQCHL